MEDAAAIAALINTHNRRLWGEDSVTAGIVEHWFSIPDLDRERDFAVAEAEDGSLVAYGDVTSGGEARRRFHLDLRLLPTATHEVGMALLARLESRARERAADDALARGFFAAPDRPMRRVYTTSGYRLVRHSLRMDRSLADEVEAPAWPEGLAVRTADRDNLEPVWRAVQEGFADHWEHEDEPFERFVHWAEMPDQDLTLWFLAMDGDDIAGACLCDPYESGTPGAGHVASLSVRPPWRRRGLALALLRHAFTELRERGRTRVSLGVDAENTTGAVRLYERAGMKMTRRYDVVDKSLD